VSQTYRSITDSERFERVLDQVTHVFDLAENVKMRRRRVDHVQWNNKKYRCVLHVRRNSSVRV